MTDKKEQAGRAPVIRCRLGPRHRRRVSTGVGLPSQECRRRRRRRRRSNDLGGFDFQKPNVGRVLVLNRDKIDNAQLASVARHDLLSRLDHHGVVSLAGFGAVDLEQAVVVPRGLLS